MSEFAKNGAIENSQRCGSTSCKALLDVATPELFQRNSFRITGLPVDATPREIAKHADKLKILEELGDGESVHTAAFALKPPPSVDQIRDATQALKDPERRLIDELFWFWPESPRTSNPDPALQALALGASEKALEIWAEKESDPKVGVIAMHNTAVLWHLLALDWEQYVAKATATVEQRASLEKYWRNSFKRWELLVDDDLFWEHVASRVKQIDDPRLTTGFVRRLRATLPTAFHKINAELAIRYADKGQAEFAPFTYASCGRPTKDSTTSMRHPHWFWLR